MTTVFKDPLIFDGRNRELKSGLHVVVEGELIADITNTIPRASGIEIVDCQRRVLTPGLIDAHVHVIADSADLSPDIEWPSLVHARSRHIIEGMLQRGFTTVRDGGGADAGIVAAIDQGFINGPRLVICGASLSQTGGHGDMRSLHHPALGCFENKKGGHLSRIADGVTEVRRAARDELRKGAKFIKVMA